MLYANKMFVKDFEGETFKKAYLSACKWIAKNVIKRKVEIGDVYWSIDKIHNTDLPTCRLILYAVLEDKSLINSFCDSCREFHRSFFINQEYNCNACKMQAYRKQQEEKLKIKSAYYKNKVNKKS